MIIDTKLRQEIVNFLIELDAFHSENGRKAILLSAGVEKVIWILTDTQKVFVAEQNTPWILAKWTDAIPVVEDVTIQVDQFVNQPA